MPYFLCLSYPWRFSDHCTFCPCTPLHLPCQQSLSNMLLTFKNLGVPIAPRKTEGPCTTLEFMGIILDTVRMEARLPVDKVERIQASLGLFQTKTSCTLKELQSLIGTLNFACKVIPPPPPPPGDPFCSVWSSSLARSPDRTIILNWAVVFFKDLTMWQQFIHP